MLFTAFDKLFVSSFNIEKLVECSYNDQGIYLHYFGHYSLAKTFRRFKYHNLTLKIYGINAFTFYLYTKIYFNKSTLLLMKLVSSVPCNKP